MAQAATDTRLASLGLLLGAGMIAYSYWHSRTGVGPLSAPGAAGSGQGTPIAGGKSLADLQSFANRNFLRFEESAASPGDYVLIPQPGWTLDMNWIQQQAAREGFQSSVVGGQTHVSVPYTGQQ